MRNIAERENGDAGRALGLTGSVCREDEEKSDELQQQQQRRRLGISY